MRIFCNFESKALREHRLIGSVPPEERIAGPVEPESKRDCTGECNTLSLRIQVQSVIRATILTLYILRKTL